MKFQLYNDYSQRNFELVFFNLNTKQITSKCFEIQQFSRQDRWTTYNGWREGRDYYNTSQLRLYVYIYKSRRTKQVQAFTCFVQLCLW